MRHTFGAFTFVRHGCKPSAAKVCHIAASCTMLTAHQLPIATALTPQAVHADFRPEGSRLILLLQAAGALRIEEGEDGD